MMQLHKYYRDEESGAWWSCAVVTRCLAAPGLQSRS